MFKTIVLATDLSPAWDEIVACAGEFKALGCSKVILTQVIGVKFMMGMAGRLRAEARPKLEAQKAKLEAQGLAVAIEMPTGLPAYALNEVAVILGAPLYSNAAGIIPVVQALLEKGAPALRMWR
jgi:hypothetical protein